MGCRLQAEPELPTDHPASLGSCAGRSTMDTDETNGMDKSFHAKIV